MIPLLGEKFVVRAKKIGDSEVQLEIRNIDERKTKVLAAHAKDEYGVISPDGRFLALAFIEYGSTGTEGIRKILVIDPKGQTVATITRGTVKKESDSSNGPVGSSVSAAQSHANPATSPIPPHVIVSKTGNLQPAPGYKWVTEIAGDFRVQWQPGQESSVHPHVVASDREGQWAPAAGYKFANQTDGDFRVVAQSSDEHSVASDTADSRRPATSSSHDVAEGIVDALKIIKAVKDLSGGRSSPPDKSKDRK
jgi:hypothetical protein